MWRSAVGMRRMVSEEESFRDHCCPYCQKSFSSSNEVLEHMEKH